MSNHAPTPRTGLPRRALLGAAVATAAAGALDWHLPVPAAAASTTSSSLPFAQPGHEVRPKFRWWWPDGLVRPDEIRREIDQIADAGFGGAEIAAVHHSVTDAAVLDTAHHGWGSASWVTGVEAALTQAARRGITVDLTIGPSWPAAVPGITPDSDAAVKELAYGSATLTAGTSYSGAVPAPVHTAAPGVTRQDLLLVHAARVNTANSTRKETGLDLDSVTDLSDAVTMRHPHLDRARRRHLGDPLVLGARLRTDPGGRPAHRHRRVRGRPLQRGRHPGGDRLLGGPRSHPRRTCGC